MWLSLLEWLAGFILKYLLGRATDAAIKAAENASRLEKEQEVNAANAAIYEQAKSREERIQAALALLNRNSTP